MIVRQAIRLENTDLASVSKLRAAFNLVGGEHSREALPEVRGKPATHPDHKCFNFIFSNDFALDNVEDAVAFIKLRHIELYASADDVAKDMPVMADGIRASADLAVRLADEFVADLREDMAHV